MPTGADVAAKAKAVDAGWNNTGTYIGVAGVVIAGGLYYTRAIRTMFAAILALLALVAGWYMQPAEEKTKEA